MPDNSLLDFILELLSDHEAAEAFYADPDGALKAAGHAGVCGSDVDAVLPLVLDYAPVTVNTSSFDRSYDTGNHGSSYADGGSNSTGGGHHAPPPPPSHHDDDHDHAVQQIHHILNTYSYTYSSVDDRDTITDQSVNQNIWAKGDVTQWFDNDSVVASGDGAVAAGDDAEGVITGDGNIVGDGNVTGDENIVGHGNTEVTGDGNIVGDDNDGNLVGDGDGNVVGDDNQAVTGDDNVTGFGSGDVTSVGGDLSASGGSSVAIGGDSSVDNSETDNSVNDSFNSETDNSTNDSFNDESTNTVDNSTTFGG
jgi:hypothetical protein